MQVSLGAHARRSQRQCTAAARPRPFMAARQLAVDVRSAGVERSSKPAACALTAFTVASFWHTRGCRRV